MKKLIAFLIFSFLIPATCFSEECNTALKSSDTYQELSIILNCLSNKIQSLEKELKILRSGGATATQNTSQSLLDNKYISIYDLRVSKNTEGIRINFIIKNKNDKDVLIAANRVTSITIDAMIVDNMGGSAYASSHNLMGIKDTAEDRTSPKSFTVLNPGVPTPVSILFKSDNIKGKVLSLRVGMLHLITEGVKPINYSFGATNIQID